MAFPVLSIPERQTSTKRSNRSLNHLARCWFNHDFFVRRNFIIPYPLPNGFSYPIQRLSSILLILAVHPPGLSRKPHPPINALAEQLQAPDFYPFIMQNSSINPFNPWETSIVINACNL
jgi:hypothetical protein